MAKGVEKKGGAVGTDPSGEITWVLTGDTTGRRFGVLGQKLDAEVRFAANCDRELMSGMSADVLCLECTLPRETSLLEVFGEQYGSIDAVPETSPTADSFLNYSYLKNMRLLEV